MRTLILTGILTVIALLIGGCAERNEAINMDNRLIFHSQVQTPGWAQGLCVYNDTAYIADDEMGISIIDVSNLNAPKFVRNYPTTGATKTVRVANKNPNKGTTILLVIEANGLRFYQMHNDSLVGNFGSSKMSDLDAVDLGQDSVLFSSADADDGLGVLRTTYVVDTIFGLQYWDDSQKMFFKPNFSLYRGVKMDGDYTYLAHSEYGLQILQIDYSTAGAFPVTKLGYVDTPGSAYDVALTGNGYYACVADYAGGFQVVDVHDRTTPKVVGVLDPPGTDRAIRVEAIDNLAFFIDQYIALYAADVTNPTNPQLVGTYLCPRPTGLWVDKKNSTIRVFLTDEYLGLVIFTVN